MREIDLLLSSCLLVLCNNITNESVQYKLYIFYNVIRCMEQERARKNEAYNNNSNNNSKKHLPLARGFVRSFSTMLSYAISSATPESLTSFSLTAIQILFFANKSSSSSYACVCTGMRQQPLMVVWCVYVGACVFCMSVCPHAYVEICVSNERRKQKKTENYFKHTSTDIGYIYTSTTVYIVLMLFSFIFYIEKLNENKNTHRTQQQ